MKKVLFFLLLSSSFFAQGQSLKEALYGGKLKNEPGKVIRKGDDLTTKIDTTQTSVTSNEVTTLSTDSSAIREVPTENAAVTTTDVADNSADSVITSASGTITDKTEKAPALKDNNAVWKEYINGLVSNLKTDALPSKKIKRGSYYILVSYSIDTTGLVTISDVFVSPENTYLQQQVKDRITIEAPTLTPVLNSSGTPRKVNKKINFTLVKE